MAGMDLKAAVLVGATLTMGLVTGAFALYAHAIMPGLKATDDRTFVLAFQSIDRAIINPWFMLTGFGGALVLTAVAAVTQLGKDPLPYVAAALALYVVAVVITVAVNVPLNDAIKAATDLTDVATIREQFHETRWAAWNLVRVVVSTGAFALLAYALIVYGRSA